MRQGIEQSAAELQAHNVDIEGALASVKAAGERRQWLQLVAVGLVIVAGLTLALNASDINDMLNIERNLPPAERGLQDDHPLDEDADITDAEEREGGAITRTDGIGFGLAPGSNGRLGSQVDRSDKRPTTSDGSPLTSEEEPGVPVASGKRAVTIRFSYYVNPRRESEVSCSLRLRRGSDGVEMLQAAVDQDCIRSFRTASEEDRVMIRCINDICSHVTNSPGLVPDTRWDADWTGDGGDEWQSAYWRFGLQGFSASAGDFFTAYVYAVN